MQHPIEHGYRFYIDRDMQVFGSSIYAFGSSVVTSSLALQVSGAESNPLSLLCPRSPMELVPEYLGYLGSCTSLTVHGL